MEILLTNDDGYYAAGIRTLARALRDVGHAVTVCAPSRDSSGNAHMVNFFGGISYEKVDMPDGIETYSVEGTPADCVIFAIRHLFEQKRFDAVISGVNNVLNIGSDAIYSGTVGAAQEGTFQRVPSLAVSLRAKGSEDFSFAAEFIVKNLEELLAMATENITINVNIPSVAREDVKGVRVAHMVYRPYEEKFEKISVDGKDVYIQKGKPLKDALGDVDGDCYLAKNGYIVLTPIKLIANDFDAIAKMKQVEGKLWR